MANKVTQSDIVQMNELYLQLKTYAAVARETGFSSSTVSKYINHNYKSIEEKESTRVRFTETLVPLSTEKIDKFRDLVGHWGLMCTLSDDEWEGMKKLYDEV